MCDVTTVQLSNGFMKMYLPSSFIRAETNVHAFMIELDQQDY